MEIEIKITLYPKCSATKPPKRIPKPTPKSHEVRRVELAVPLSLCCAIFTIIFWKAGYMWPLPKPINIAER